MTPDEIMDEVRQHEAIAREATTLMERLRWSSNPLHWRRYVLWVGSEYMFGRDSSPSKPQVRALRQALEIVKEENLRQAEELRKRVVVVDWDEAAR